MRYAQPAVVSVKGYCRAQRRREARGMKTTPVNTRMATIDHADKGRLLTDMSKNHTQLCLSAVTLSNDETGTELGFEQSDGHDSEQLSNSFVPAAPRQATEREATEQVVSG